MVCAGVCCLRRISGCERYCPCVLRRCTVREKKCRLATYYKRPETSIDSQTPGSMTPSNKKKLRLEQAHLSPERLKTAKIEECIRNLRRRRRYLDLSILFLHLHIPSLERRTQSNFTSVLSRNSPTQSPKAALPYLQGFPGVLHTTRPLHEGEKQATHHPLSINVRYGERCNKTLEELKGKEHELSLHDTQTRRNRRPQKVTGLSLFTSDKFHVN